MDQLEVERVEPSHSSANSRKSFRDIASNRKSIAIGVLALAVIGAVISIVYVFENSDTRSDEDPQILIKHALQQQRQRERAKKVMNVRLPTTLQPLEYKLSLIPYLSPAKNFTIDGTVAIDVLCKDVTDKVTLNIKEITIKEPAVRVVQLDNVDGAAVTNVSIPIKGHEYDPDRDFYIAVLEENLLVGFKYRVYIEYIALLSEELVGFYRSSYIDKATNETRWLGITQFSPTDARRAFPSFDEPALKARFEISLGRLENMTSLSNMNRVRTEPIEGMPGWYWDRYNKTLLMSTYLVGFAVTDFVPREAHPGLSRPKIQIWSRKDALDQTGYAAKVGPKMLSFFEEYFKIEFPLPKQDIVAVPDMRFSAMENWGLITFRELYILFDPKYSSEAAKQQIILIVGHEIAHQWFGNLVTPSWWSELWLKEGFASYVAYIGANHVEPSFRILEIFLINDFQKVLRMDALNISHPIQVPVDHPDEINQVFDAISYSKGCSLLRMMDHFLTEKTFRQGITNYLNKWQYNSTTQQYLWDSLTEQAHADGTLPKNLTVGEIMNMWTLQKGYPLIKVERNHTSGNFTLSREKFNLLPNATGDENEYKWWVPISYASSTFNSDFSSTKPSFWMPPTVGTMEVRMDTASWVIVNVQSTGYYRVTYDDETWSSITKQLVQDPSKIHIQNRAQLIDDVLNIARTVPRLYETAFSLTTQYIRNEREYLPWNSYVVASTYLYNVFSKTPSMDLLKSYFRKQLHKEYERLGFNETESESHLDRAHRVDIIEWACKVGLDDCRQKATEMFAGWMNQPAENKIPVNLRRTIYCIAVANGDKSVWNFAWSQYLAANVASEKDILLRALTCSRNETTLQRYLEWSITEGSGVRKQDSRSVMQNIALNEVGNGLVFKFLQTQWPRIRKYFSGGLSIDKVINNGVAQLLTTEQELQQLLNFKSEHDGDFGYGARAVEEAIEITKINIRWMKESYEAVSSLLGRYV